MQILDKILESINGKDVSFTTEEWEEISRRFRSYESYKKNMSILRSCLQDEEDKVHRYETKFREIAHLVGELNLQHLTIVDTF